MGRGGRPTGGAALWASGSMVKTLERGQAQTRAIESQNRFVHPSLPPISDFLSVSQGKYSGRTRIRKSS